MMSVGAVGLACLILFSGIEIPGFIDSDSWWLFSGDAQTTRDLLSALLSGMITMTSLVVSITMVVLSLAAGQLGPRDERRLLKLQRDLAAVKLLIVDELGYVPLSPTGAELLFEAFSQRYERGSTISHPICPSTNGRAFSGASG